MGSEAKASVERQPEAMNINAIRLKSLRILIGFYGGSYGSPALNVFLMELRNRGLVIDDSSMSNILCEKKVADDKMSKQIEDAFQLPPGWLSSVHERTLFSSEENRRFFDAFAQLKPETRKAFAAIAYELISACE